MRPDLASTAAAATRELSFGEAIAYELRGTGVTVTTLCPGPTTTGFADAAEMKESVLFNRIKPMSSAEVARIGYRAMKAGKRVAITGAANKLSAIGGRLSPRGLLLPIANYLNSEG